MTVLTVGRIQLVNLSGLASSRDAGGRTVSFTGRIFGVPGGSILDVRDELEAQVGLLVPVAVSTDPNKDGFYRVVGVTVDTFRLWDGGGARISVETLHLGSAADLIFRSVLTSTVLRNDHGITASEAAPYHAPPGGHSAYSAVTSSVVRTSEDGGMRVYRDITDIRPVWSSTPAAWYTGAAEFYSGGQLRAGLDHPADATGWQLSNGLIRVTPHTTGGRVEVATYTSDWATPKVWRLQISGVDVGPWEWVSILRNDPEQVTIRLAKSAAGGGLQTLDLSVRRGSRFVVGHLTAAASATLKVVITPNEAGTTVTPPGASSAVGVNATANDADGNRYLIAAALSHTGDTSRGGVSKSGVTELGFMVGAEIGGSTAVAGDTSEDLCLQYVGLAAETTRSLRR